MEFFRITNVNLLSTFKGSLEKYTPPLLQLYRNRREALGLEMKSLLDKLDDKDSYTKGVKMAILTVIEDDVGSAASLPNVISTAVILEEAIVLQDIADLPTAFGYLFGLVYAINMEYPEELKYTFEVMQKLFMDLGGGCSARVQSLKSKLC
ncbi:hypothetical protein SKAU_G00233760 [Synaphobranchus kaupii]|uniref:Uncharacterized protein n=1 Tax=Synaphobranchus kaupii TaxID=118154 RepID=A0A9Q1F6D8_SYNKA|nr:hypothetical protein SKAU_G00233760 [Synaphobranchus kaupii]